MRRADDTARPPLPVVGEYGYNLDINAPEYFDGSAWTSLLLPTGSIIDFAGATAPVGFLMNDGAGIITITVNGMVINLLASDKYINESFVEFSTVIITCTSVAYRLFLRS